MTDPAAVVDRSHIHLGAVARGSAATLGGAIVSTVAGFGLVLLVTRTVDAATAGRFFAATSVFLVALATAGLGTDTGLARFVLRTDGPDAVRSLLRNAAMPVLATSVALAVGLAIVVPATRGLVWALPCAAAADLCLAAVRAHASFRSTVVVDRIARPGLQIVLVGAVLALGLPGAWIAVAWAAAYVASAALAARSLSRLVPARSGRPSVAPGGTGGRAFWTFTWPRAVARIAQVAVQKLDIVLVAWLLSPADAAVYTVATRFVVFGQLANQAVSSVVQPRFTIILADDAHDPDDRTISHVFGTTACWSVLLAWPVYLCVAAAPAAYLGWFGAGYATTEAVTVALVMSAGMLVAVASGPVDTLLLMAGRSGRSLANTLLALAVDLGLCLLLLPRMGIAGAAVAWVVAVVLRCLLAIVQLRAEVRLVLDLRGLLLAGAVPIACVALPLAALQLLVGLGPASWLAACAVAAAGYVAVVWRLRVPLAVDLFVAGLGGRRTAGAAA